MADEAIDPSLEQQPGQPGAAPAKPAKASMLPLIIVVVTMPLVSFAMVKFAIVPGIRSDIAAKFEALKSGEGEGAEGGTAEAGKSEAKDGGNGKPAEKKDDGHGAKPAEKKDDAHGAKPAEKKEGGGHADSGSAEKPDKNAAKKTKSGWEIDFPTVVSSLTGSLGTKYVKCTFSVVSDDAEIRQIVDENKSKLRDTVITVLRARSLADMEALNAKTVLCSEIAANFNRALNSNTVKQIFLTELLIQ
jgi:flagellar basal body-associated protein FliL